MNPYDSPTSDDFSAPQPGAPGKVTQLQLMEPFQFPFQSPNWFTNVLLATLCIFIPAVGPIVVLGYQYTIVEYLHRRWGPGYPDFDFGKFGEYLSRGIWPFVVSLIANVVMVPIIWVMMVAPWVCVGFASAAIQDSAGDAVAILCFVVGAVFIVVAVIAISIFFGLIMMPMMLSAGLCQELGPAFNFSFIKDFIGKMWKDMTLAFLVFTLIAWLAMAVGALVLCIGMYAAIAVIAIAYAHLSFQLYEVYLSRGGMQLPLKDPQPA